MNYLLKARRIHVDMGPGCRFLPPMAEIGTNFNALPANVAKLHETSWRMWLDAEYCDTVKSLQLARDHFLRTVRGYAMATGIRPTLPRRLFRRKDGHCVLLRLWEAKLRSIESVAGGARRGYGKHPAIPS